MLDRQAVSPARRLSISLVLAIACVTAAAAVLLEQALVTHDPPAPARAHVDYVPAVWHAREPSVREAMRIRADGAIVIHGVDGKVNPCCSVTFDGEVSCFAVARSDCQAGSAWTTPLRLTTTPGTLYLSPSLQTFEAYYDPIHQTFQK